jgi:hypothetical protein
MIFFLKILWANMDFSRLYLLRRINYTLNIPLQCSLSLKISSNWIFHRFIFLLEKIFSEVHFYQFFSLIFLSIALHSLCLW